MEDKEHSSTTPPAMEVQDGVTKQTPAPAEPNMPGIHDLRREVESMIRPWKSSMETPPFKAGELLIMALVCEGCPLDMKGITQWIASSFIYYQSHLVRFAFFYIGFNDSTVVIEDLYQGLEEAVKEFDLPIEAHGKMGDEVDEYDDDESDDDEYDDDNRSWSLDAKGARWPLTHALGGAPTQSSQPCRFFSLPAELRTKIYEMVFNYPPSGLIAPPREQYHRRPREPMCFKILTRSYDTPFDFTESNKRDDLPIPPDYDHPTGNYMLRYSAPLRTLEYFQLLKTPSTGQILAPLATCKQFYKEAMPTFYRINHFHFRAVEDLGAFLQKAPPTRTKHLSQISVSATRETSRKGVDTNAISAFEALAKLEHLRSLEIGTGDWLGQRDKEPDESIMERLGLDKLRSLRGLEEVSFHGGDCRKGMQELRTTIMKAKGVDVVEPGRLMGSAERKSLGVETRAMKRKAKAADDDDVEFYGGDKRTKKTGGA